MSTVTDEVKGIDKIKDEIKDLKIEIRPIPNRGDIKKFSENLEYFSQSNTLPCLVNSETMRHATGLSEEDIAYLKEIKFPYDVSDDRHVPGRPHPFWEMTQAKVELKSSPTFLYPGKNPWDFIKYRYLMVSNFIYVSEQEIDKGHKTEATHFIYNKSLEQEAKASKLEAKNKRITKVSQLSLKRKRDIIMIIENEDTSSQDENYLTLKFDEITNHKEKTALLDKLLKGSAEDISLEAEIKTAIYRNVLTRTPKGIFFFETNLGYSEKEVKEFLNKKENQELYLRITSGQKQ